MVVGGSRLRRAENFDWSSVFGPKTSGHGGQNPEGAKLNRRSVQCNPGRVPGTVTKAPGIIMSKCGGNSKLNRNPAIRRGRATDSEIREKLIGHFHKVRTMLCKLPECAIESSLNAVYRTIAEADPARVKLMGVAIEGNEASYPLLDSVVGILKSGGTVGKCTAKLRSFVGDLEGTRLAALKVECGSFDSMMAELGERYGQKVQERSREAREFCQDIECMIETAVCLRREINARAKSLPGEYVVSALRGGKPSRIRLEAHVNGIDRDGLDWWFCDRKNVISDTQYVGDGHNKVRKITYKMRDGTKKTFFFKPDFGARSSLRWSSVLGDVCKDNQQCVKINKAACAVAKLLGLERLTVECHETVLDGEYGLLMETAPGCSLKQNRQLVQKLRNKLAGKRSDDMQCLGSLGRDYNDLLWLFHAIGNGDCNTGNLIVDSESWHVKSIDYDLSFPPYLIGIDKFKVACNGKQWAGFKNTLESVCKEIYPKVRDWKEKQKKLLQEIKMNRGTIDAKSTGNVDTAILAAIFRGLGFMTVNVPKQMSRELCEALKKLTDDKVMDFAEKALKRYIVDSQAIDATVQRLKDLREIAIQYDRKRGGRIVEDEDWKKVEVLERELQRDVELPDGKKPSQIDFAACWVSAGLMDRDINLISFTGNDESGNKVLG